jgi:hypothetical protein
VTADIEDRVIVLWFHVGELHGLRQSLLRSRIALKPHHRLGLIFREVALGIDRWLAACGRGERQLHTGISKDEVRGSKLFQPEARLAASVAELIVRG